MKRSQKQFALGVILIVAMVLPSLAHDLFLKLDRYFISVNDEVTVKIFNGSFMGSEGPVRYERLEDLAMVSPSEKRSKPGKASWTQDDRTSYLKLRPDEPGNYLVGLSTMAREIDLDAKSFNEYLAEDGIPDTLAERGRNKELDKNVRERYSKHVKTLFQVGDKHTQNYKYILGYPVEIVPRNNPYKLRKGDTFEFLCLKDGKPLANQNVMTGYDDGVNLRIGESIRTDKKGTGRLRLSSAGNWYVKFIHMTRLNDEKVNYESKWATFTFGIR